MASGICFTVSELKSRLGLSVTTYDGELSGILDAVNATLEVFLGYDPTDPTITEYLSTRGEVETPLVKRPRSCPVTSVTSVYLDESGRFGLNPDGAFATATLLVVGTDYSWTANGFLQRIGTRWPYTYTRGIDRLAPTVEWSRGCVKVTYVVDNTRVLAVAKQAGLMEAAAIWASRDTGMGAVLGESVDGYSLTVSPFQHTPDPTTGFLSPAAALMLKPFRITPVA